MTDFDHLRWERLGLIAVVTLDRPPVNAVDQQMYRELRTLFSDVQQMGDDLRAIVLQGAGPHFCAGNDLEDFASMTPTNARERMFHVREAFSAIYRADLPVVAAVQGAALGTGLAIAASCDVIVASDTARLGLPEIKIGVMGGARHLSRLLPPGMVRYLHYTGEPLPASAFVPFGAVLQVVAPDRLRHGSRGRAVVRAPQPRGLGLCQALVDRDRTHGRGVRL